MPLRESTLEARPSPTTILAAALSRRSHVLHLRGGRFPEPEASAQDPEKSPLILIGGGTGNRAKGREGAARGWRGRERGGSGPPLGSSRGLLARGWRYAVFTPARLGSPPRWRAERFQNTQVLGREETRGRLAWRALSSGRVRVRASHRVHAWAALTLGSASSLLWLAISSRIASCLVKSRSRHIEPSLSA